ncbi:TPA: RraA family protein [Candidatus Woesearchaeota archaeon]|nr:RraA family protein [Candidatus Woesearchaeota archaeon]
MKKENVKKYISTALISDILDDMGYQKQVLSVEIKPNFHEAKIFGYARTLKLKTLSPKDDYRDIYKGLSFIESMNTGEVLIVSGGSKKYAFFGELMSTLAQKRNVEGAIIDGLTRDSAQTRKMKFPVFSRDNYARDIKKRGIIVAQDVSVYVDKVQVNKGDLIIGDCDGVIIVPQSLENDVLNRALESAKLEERIKKAITNGVSVEQILKQNGEF